jgi:hypothetical protein
VGELSVPDAVRRFFSAAPQSRDRHERKRLVRPRLCSAPLRKSYALRCVRGTNERYAMNIRAADASVSRPPKAMKIFPISEV